MTLDDSFEMNGNGLVRGNYIPSPKKEEPGLKWRDLITNFSQATTFHGLRYISEKESHLCRRLIWFLLTVLFTVLLVLQIIDRVTYYYQSPMTVNFQVNYNQSLHFPAITLCNQNAFRATAASRLGWYRVVEHLYGDSETNFTWSNQNGGNITMDQLYLGLAHRREDFINSCMWAGEPCYAENFTLTLTDHGLCYTFNNLSNTDRDISVFSSGVEHGLRLTINTEQYEAMPGPHDTSGIKILVTDQSQFPRVDEIGVAIPTGAHSYIGLGVVVIRNLPKPHGDCGTRKLMSTDVYSPDMCRLEYITKYVINMCGCRHIYMPNIDGDHPLCTIKQYLDCAQSAYEYIHKRVVEESACPTSCDYKIFEMSTSSASTSSQVGNYALKPDLEERFHDAIETTHRLNEATFKSFETVVRQVSETFKNVRALLEQSIQEKLERQLEVLEDIKRNISDAVDTKDTVYRYQEYTMLKNFMRARDAMEERTLSMVCQGFHEHVFNTEFKLRHMFTAQQKGENEADVLYTLLKNTLRSRMETATRAIANQTQLYDAYANGQKIFNYKFRDIPRLYNEAIVPKPLLAKSLVHNYYANRYAPRVKTDIELVYLFTKNFEELVDEIHDNISIGLNVSKMEEISGNFIDACEDFFHSKSTFYFEVVDRPLRIIVQRIQEFDTLKMRFDQTLAGLNVSLEALNNSLTTIEEGFIKNLTDYLDMANQYFKTNDSFGNVTKYDLALAFTSAEITDYHHSIVVLFHDLRNKGQFIYSQWTELWSLCHQIWKTILEDEDSLEYYNVRKIFQYNFTDMAVELEERFRKIQDDNDMRLIGETVDNVFTLTMNDLIAHLQGFLAKTKIDESFIKENFLTLDIYFKELRHEEIEQQKAYDVIALLCDIGGSMGLFLGASALSIFEIVDFLVHNSAIKLLPGCKNRKRAYSI